MITVKFPMGCPDRSIEIGKRYGVVFYFLLMLCLVTPIPGVASDPVAGSDNGDMAMRLLMVLLGAAVLAALIIIWLVAWGRKQDHLAEMVHFCLKYLVHSEDEVERCASAKALGSANDPGALLVLLDVSLDEEEKGTVRKAAGEALHELGDHLRKSKKVITDIELLAEQKDYQGIIDTLTTNFEHGKTTYPQSAYLVARQYMRLNHFSAARDWLNIAKMRNRKTNLYGNQIQHWIHLSNTRLLEEADIAFKEHSYQEAKKKYAALDKGLDEADRKSFAIYLRTACVFVMLKDYQNADQALLQALAKNHGTDLGLTLVPLLQETVKFPDPQIVAQSAQRAIEKRSSEIMSTLFSKQL